MSAESTTAETTDLATLYRDLTEAQADGLACVVCEEDFTIFLGATVPVGVSLARSQVFACKVGCAAKAVSARREHPGTAVNER